MKNKLLLLCAFFSTAVFFVGCDKDMPEDNIDILDKNSKDEIRRFDPSKVEIKRIDISDIPEGLTPLKFDSQEEAFEYFRQRVQSFFDILPNKQIDTSFLKNKNIIIKN